MNSARATRAAVGPATFPFNQLAPAARVIEGEHEAGDFLDRIHTGMAQPDELAVIVAYLCGELLHGFCRLLQKVLEAWHG